MCTCSFSKDDVVAIDEPEEFLELVGTLLSRFDLLVEGRRLFKVPGKRGGSSNRIWDVVQSDRLRKLSAPYVLSTTLVPAFWHKARERMVPCKYGGVRASPREIACVSVVKERAELPPRHPDLGVPCQRAFQVSVPSLDVSWMKSL